MVLMPTRVSGLKVSLPLVLFCFVLFYAVAKESEEHREKIERLHRRISSVDKNRNKTPLVSLILLSKKPLLTWSEYSYHTYNL